MCWTLWKVMETHPKVDVIRWTDWKRGDLVEVNDDGVPFGILPTRPWFRIFTHPGLHKSAFDEFMEAHLDKHGGLINVRKFYLAMDANTVDTKGRDGPAEMLRKWIAMGQVIQLDPAETRQLITLKRTRTAPQTELVEAWQQ